MLFFNANFICYYFYPTKKREEPLFFPAVALFPSTHQNSHSKSRSGKSGFLVKDFVSFREGINL